jgi:hypothetical protein
MPYPAQYKCNHHITKIFPQRYSISAKRYIYILSLNHVDSEICHLLQNSDIVLAKYGLLKLIIKLISSIFAQPNAISEYPEKSQ